MGATFMPTWKKQLLSIINTDINKARYSLDEGEYLCLFKECTVLTMLQLSNLGPRNPATFGQFCPVIIFRQFKAAVIDVIVFFLVQTVYSYLQNRLY